MKKRKLLALILVFALALPVAVSAAELPKRIEAVHQMKSLPESWNPLAELSAEAELILSLTTDRLYVLSPDGQTLTPSLAAEMPEDVTAAYAGSYSIPDGSLRGYAFRIELEPEAAWEDGAPITADDHLFTIHQLIDAHMLGLDLANLSSFYENVEKTTDNIVSLVEAGFGSVEEAREAGRTEFYVDTSHFWGLDTGWKSISDRERLKDAAIPSGITEMYVSGAYLYDRYLRTGASQSVFQTEFVGVSAEAAYVTREDIGLIREDAHSLVLILEEPVTAGTLALKLSGLTLLREDLFGEDYATSAATYSACGPYRIVSAENGEILLEPNPHWLGRTETVEADIIRLTA